MKTATALAPALLVPLTGRAQDQAKSWRVGILHVGLDHVPSDEAVEPSVRLSMEIGCT